MEKYPTARIIVTVPINLTPKVWNDKGLKQLTTSDISQ